MNIYEIRKAGREYCQTEGSEHYKTGNEAQILCGYKLTEKKQNFGFKRPKCLNGYCSGIRTVQGVEECLKLSIQHSIDRCGLREFEEMEDKNDNR